MSEIQDAAPAAQDTTIITLPNGITLRRFALSDIEPTIISLNNPAVRRFLRNAIPTPYTEDNAKWWINHCNDETTWIQSGPWISKDSDAAAEAVNPITKPSHSLLPTHYAIVQNGVLIGAIGITPKDDIYFRTVELGYWLAEPCWGKGIMGAVAKAYVNWVFSTFGIVYRIEAQVFEANLQSSNVLRKAGLSHEGQKKGAVWKDNKISAEDMFGIVRDKELDA